MPGTVLLEGKRLGKRDLDKRFTGEVLKSMGPISFLGDIDPTDGIVKDRASNIYGRSVKGKVLVFPRGKGSTVGSFVIYGLQDQGNAPVAMVVEQAEAIVATGAVMAGIPLIDRIDISKMDDGDTVTVIGSKLEIERRARDG